MDITIVRRLAQSAAAWLRCGVPAVAAALAWQAAAQVPVRLTTDLIEHTDRVFVGGYLSSVPISDMRSAIEDVRVADIRSDAPAFAWAVADAPDNTVQTACRILVATKPELLREGAADVWDSRRIEGAQACGVAYGGAPLKASTLYYWTVKIWDNHGGESPYAAPKAFRTAAKTDGQPSHYPLTKTDEWPLKATPAGVAATVYDFGTDAFAQLSITVATDRTDDTLTVHLGEQLSDGRVNRRPEGTQRYAVYRMPLLRGTHTYRVKIRKDRRNTERRRNESGVDPIFMPGYVGEVFPFRYVETEGAAPLALVRHTVSYPFDDNEAHFVSSDTVLNKVWELCKYTVKAISFAGIYVDGDRERIPYEADAIINQLCHYAVDRDCSMARRSVKHLVYNPTWPTEWQLQTPIMAWNDYLYTGDVRLLRQVYDDLKEKTLLALRSDNGLISTRTGKVTEEVKRKLHFKGKRIKDIVDWPQTGAKGVEKEADGEADGFVFRDYNTVVNAYHCHALRLMAKVAEAVGNEADRRFYEAEAARAVKAFNALMLDRTTGLYRDGIGTAHSSLHANMFPLGFGLVPEKRRDDVTAFVKSRRMGCSVYGAQFLLDALYDMGEADYALSLLNSTGRRSWYNMLRIGSTITTEAWDNVFKPNQDWNHAWGAAAGNIIARKLMGVEPVEPGFARFRVKPQPGSLAEASITVPTVKGTVAVALKNEPGRKFRLELTVPANTQAEVWLPRLSETFTVDGRRTRGKASGKFVTTTVGSGFHVFEIVK